MYMTTKFFRFLKTLIKCKYSNSIALLVYKRSFSWPQNVLQKRLDSFCVWYYLSSQKSQENHAELYNILFFQVAILETIFSQPILFCSLFVFCGIGRKVCVVALNTQYKFIEPFQFPIFLFLDWKWKNEKWVQCLGGLFSVWYLIQTWKFET